MALDYQIHELTGAELDPWVDELGKLRIRVFREYPYLYNGTLAYEREYLRSYQQAWNARVVVVVDGAGAVVAATTCVPLAEQGPEYQEPFQVWGYDVGRVLYLGESIALPEWRGRGLGKEFFDRREAHARKLGLTITAFCAVDRPAVHPLRPPGFRPLDGFWESRGYMRQPGMRAVFHWQEIGEAAESPKTLTFWLRSWKY